MIFVLLLGTRVNETYPWVSSIIYLVSKEISHQINSINRLISISAGGDKFCVTVCCVFVNTV